MFKKRVFRDGDDKVDDKTFQYLTFLQLQDEYLKARRGAQEANNWVGASQQVGRLLIPFPLTLSRGLGRSQGNYPVTPSDAARLCAVLIQANGGVRGQDELLDKVARAIPASIRMTLAPPGSEGEQDLLQASTSSGRPEGLSRSVLT